MGSLTANPTLKARLITLEAVHAGLVSLIRQGEEVAVKLEKRVAALEEKFIGCGNIES